MKRSARAGAVALLLGAVAFAGCSDDDEDSQERYCEAGESLEASLTSLTDLDLIATGTDGLNEAVDQVQSDLAELRDAASDAAAEDVDALEESVDELSDAISALGGELSSDNVSTVTTAIQNVGSSAQAVRSTLADC